MLVLKNKRYFIQARLILHTLDTRAVEAVVVELASTSNSKNGCPLCRGITGIHDNDKCVYIGHSKLLPQDHPLRFIGQSGKCCVEGFYQGKEGEKKPWQNEEFNFKKYDSTALNLQSFGIQDHAIYKTRHNKCTGKEQDLLTFQSQ